MLSRNSLSLLLLGACSMALAGCSGGVPHPGETASRISVENCSNHGVVYGIDVSSYQGDAIDWNAVKQSGRQFGIVKSSEWAVDSSFGGNWRGMRAAGVIRGAYHFFHPSASGAAQANMMLDAIDAAGGLLPGDLPPTIDVEVTDGLDDGSIRTQVDAFAAAVRARTGKPPMVYSYASFFTNTLGSPNYGGPLWIAAYTNGSGCPLVGGWQFWQYNDADDVPGVPPGVDGDVFNGTLEELVSLTGGSATSQEHRAIAVAPNQDGRLEAFVRGADGQLWHQWQVTAGGAWSGGFAPMAGNMTDAPAAAINADGRLEVFVRGSDGRLWHQWQLTPGGGWSGFATMQGQMLGSPAVARNADGRLEVFVRGADWQLWHQWQLTPGGSWSGFWPLTGNITDSPDVGVNADGRLEVFARGGDGQLWHQSQLTAGGGWSGFAPLGVQMLGSPAVGRNADGRLEVFVRGSDWQLWHEWQWTAGGSWSFFTPLGGNLADSPAVVANADGRLEVFVRGADEQLWHQWQGTAGTSWSGFAPLGGNMTDAPVATGNADGRLEVFVRGSDGQLWHDWQVTNGGAWFGLWPLTGQLGP